MARARHAIRYSLWLTLALFAYFGTVLVVKVPWSEAAWGFATRTTCRS